MSYYGVCKQCGKKEIILHFNDLCNKCWNKEIKKREKETKT